MVYVPGRIREGPGGRGFDGQTMSLLSNRIGGKPKKIWVSLFLPGKGEVDFSLAKDAFGLVRILPASMKVLL